MSHAYNAFKALDGYTRSTGATVEWGKKNPKAWEFVSNVIADRKERMAMENSTDGI